MDIQWLEDNDGNPYPVMFDEYTGNYVRLYARRDDDGNVSYAPRRDADYEPPPPLINVTRGGKTESVYADLAPWGCAFFRGRRSFAWLWARSFMVGRGFPRSYAWLGSIFGISRVNPTAISGAIRWVAVYF